MAALFVLALAAPAALAAPLPSNCDRDQGTVTCTEGPGKNQGGVGAADETQGNTTNKSPAPQNLSCEKNPPKAQGGAIGEIAHSPTVATRGADAPINVPGATTSSVDRTPFLRSEEGGDKR